MQRVFLSIFSLLVLLSAIRPSAVAERPERLPEAEAITALQAELKTEAADGRFSGAVLVAKAGKPIFQAAYGYADREKRIRNRIDTKFRFGSMGKMFTAVGIIQLVQTGKMKLDDTIAKYLRDYPDKDVAAVTIHELLTHTGGTGDIFGPSFEAHRTELKDLSDYIALYGSRGLQFTPGTRWEYSNYGYLLLGRIIEVATGQNYYNYVRDHIFKPARMDSTDNLPEGPARPRALHRLHQRGSTNVASPFRSRLGPASAAPQSLPSRAEGPLHSTEGMLPYRGTSAGGGYSTVGDFLKFVDALTSDTLLNVQYTALLTAGKVNTLRPGNKIRVRI